MPIQVNNLEYTYLKGTPFEHKALTDVNFSVEDGEFLGIIGHTGSGKSTLVQIMCGLIHPSSGEVLLDGEDIFKMKNFRRHVGMVFQYPEYQLFEETIAKDIAFGPTKIGMENVDEGVRYAMELVGLDYDVYASKSPFELSGGQKRKVAIAGVLAMKPRVLILDEPISGLDPIAREKLMELIDKLNKSGTTIIMISHNMEGLAEHAGRIIAMAGGEIILNDTPKKVFSDHERIREVGLDLPEAAIVTEKLLSRGFDIPKDIVTYGELKQYLKKAVAAND